MGSRDRRPGAKRAVVMGWVLALAGAAAACDEKIDEFFAPLEQSITTGSITGRVTTDGVGTQATIGLTGPETRSGSTDGSGNFSFTELDPGTYQVSATASGRQCETRNVTVVAGQTTQADITCTLLPATIVVTLTSQGNPISGATVTLNGPTPGSGVTDASGMVTFTNRTAGSYTISVAATALGFSCPGGNANPAAGETANVAITCTSLTATIIVTVTSLGSPVAGATVTLTGPTPGSGSTDVNGMITFTNRTPGSYSVGATRTGFVCGSGTANPAAGQTVNVAISCTPSP
ncbi:MAG TPA: carboxypeptidase regulatory-like domain-containing protein [Gemmatimonadales bacterium]|nr:carboxypeptidase regulatory-like domain-containing protein [Gemmatimonadales bacterium]